MSKVTINYVLARDSERWMHDIKQAARRIEYNVRGWKEVPFYDGAHCRLMSGDLENVMEVVGLPRDPTLLDRHLALQVAERLGRDIVAFVGLGPTTLRRCTTCHLFPVSGGPTLCDWCDMLGSMLTVEHDGERVCDQELELRAHMAEWLVDRFISACGDLRYQIHWKKEKPTK